jgi:uncharacterized membrane protein
MSARDPGARRWLAGALLALAALYGAWFWPGADRWAALALFALPPLAMAARLLRGDAPRLRFWAGVLALAWFSHGVMVAWSRPGERGFALAAVALALAVVFAANLPGLRARFGRRGPGAGPGGLR